MSPLQAWLVGMVQRSPKTQTQIAREAGISMKHLSQMMNGHAEGSLTVWSRVLQAVDELVWWD